MASGECSSPRVAPSNAARRGRKNASLIPYVLRSPAQVCRSRAREDLLPDHHPCHPNHQHLRTRLALLLPPRVRPDRSFNFFFSLRSISSEPRSLAAPARSSPSSTPSSSRSLTTRRAMTRRTTTPRSSFPSSSPRRPSLPSSSPTSCVLFPAFALLVHQRGADSLFCVPLIFLGCRLSKSRSTSTSSRMSRSSSSPSPAPSPFLLHLIASCIILS